MMAAEREFQFDERLGGREAFLVDVFGDPGEFVARDAVQTGAAPQADRRAQQGGGLGGAALAAERGGLTDGAPEDVQVERRVVDLEDVAGRPGLDGGLDAGGRQGLAHPGHADLYLGAGGLRGILGPQQSDEVVAVLEPAALQEQGGEDDLLSARRDRHRALAAEHLQLAQHLKGESHRPLTRLQAHSGHEPSPSHTAGHSPPDLRVYGPNTAAHRPEQ